MAPATTTTTTTTTNPTLNQLEDRLRALTPTSIPGAVLLASTRSQSSAYTFACGNTSLNPAEEPHPLTAASTFWLASCTKLLTSIGCLQLVERGLLHLDEPVVKRLPEFGEIKVLEGWNDEDGSPRYSTGKGSAEVTLRHLLTHTSGLAYDFLSPDILKWWQWKGTDRLKMGGRIRESYSAPMIRGPGIGWTYSPGIDWAGKLLERASGEKSLGAYLNKHVFPAVGVTDGSFIFRAADNKLSGADTKVQWVWISMRTPDGKIIPVGSSPTDTAHDDLGGGGGRCSPREYIKVLDSLLRNDEKLLRRKTVDEYVFSPQLVDGPGKLGAHLGKNLEEYWRTIDGGRMLTGGYALPEAEVQVGVEAGQDQGSGQYEYNHGLVSALSRKKVNGKGQGGWSAHWGGLPNLQWWVDRERGVAGMMAMQLLPPGDPTCLDLAKDFREGVLKEYGTETVAMKGRQNKL